MYWWASTVVVLLVVCLESVSVQELTAREANNKLIELANSCTCVKHFLCDQNNCISTNGSLTIERRLSTQKIPCQGNFKNELVCCNFCNNSVTASTKPSVVDKNPMDDTKLNSDEESTCGVPKPVINVRIHTGDDDLNPVNGEFPWIAAIFKKTTTGRYKFICSGSLIHPNVVLTINHCIHNKRSSDLRVVVNGKTKLSESDYSPDDKRDVSEVIAHPKYNDRLLYYDAALLMLEMPYTIETWSSINVLCLPPENFNLDGKKCQVVGWGNDNSGQRSKRLKKVEVPFVNHSRCQSLLRGTKLGSSFNLHNSFMCAGGESGRDACVGDGGSPLMCTTSVGGAYFQAGIVSWGIDCGKPNVPGVYTDVKDISEWIDNEFSNRQLYF